MQQESPRPHVQIEDERQREYRGFLMIGDPHVEGRTPGFRKDDYPRVILQKIRWCIEYSKDHGLIPVFLGDIFHVPRNNPNWILVELLELWQDPVYGIYGNHDVHENSLDEDDSLSILIEAGRYRLLDAESVRRFHIGGREVLLGGASWGTSLPTQLDHFFLGQNGRSLGIWVTHHDVRLPGQYDAGDIDPVEIDGVDIVVNGHIHRRLDPVVKGQTTWMTPGNISRRKRDEATRLHAPAALRIDIQDGKWSTQYIDVEHQPFEEVFHAAVQEDECGDVQSAFVSGLAELESLKTETGHGIHEFLKSNLDQFNPEIAAEIRSLASEVTGYEE